MSDPRIGTMIGGYRIESMLGRGGMSVVYLAEHEGLERKAALKILSPELAEDPAFRQRFVAEWKTLAALDHPNIIPIFEAGEADGALFIAMRYVETTDLKALIKAEGGRLDPGRAISIIAQTASALDAAHARSLVHRDVKPANILVAVAAGAEGYDHAYLSDFGLTKHTDATSGITKTGMFMGTVDYISPEQVGGKHVDGRADQYALACVLYESLSGQVPFRREEETAALFAHLNDPPPRVTEIRPDLPPAIDDVIARAMAKEPDERFGTCTEFVRTARAALGLGQTAPAGVSVVPPKQQTLPPTPSRIAPRPPAAPPPPASNGPNRVPLIVGIVVAVIVLGVLAFTQLGGGDEGEPVAAGSTSPTGSVTGPTGPTGEPTGATGEPTGATAEPTGPAVSGPAGTVLFSDSFDDPSVGWEDSPQFGVQRELTQEGTYRFTWTDDAPVDAFATAFGGVGGVGSSSSLDLADVRVGVTATSVAIEGRTIFGLSCRVSEEQSYEIYMSPADGFWQIAEITNVGDFRSLNQGFDDTIARGLDTYRVEATCTGATGADGVTIDLVVDGRAIGTALDTKQPLALSGTVGIFAEGNTGTVTEFDDFVVEDLSA